MNEIDERPLVTLLLLSYNQEKYVEEALRAALDQTYAPLEIIFSDDCSKDRTYQLAKRICENYSGHHKLILQKNEKNLGIGMHLNKLFDQANGELIVLAAADDISEPERVEELVTLWLKSEKKYDSIWSAVSLIDERGNAAGIKDQTPQSSAIVDQVQDFVPSVLGCSHATTKRLHDKFGTFGENIVYEDRVIAFRSLISGGHGYIKKPLVKYRIHSESISDQFRASAKRASAFERLEKYRLHLSRNADVLTQYKIDAKKISSSFPDLSLLKEIIEVIDRKSDAINSEILLNSSKFSKRIIGFLSFRPFLCRSLRGMVKRLLTLIDPLLPFMLR